MQIHEILIIKNGQENYGISTDVINQISRVPMLMPLPLRPVGVRGLCSVGGGIVSLVDMNMLLGIPCVDFDAHKTRLLSLNDQHSSNALLVSEVYNTVEIDQENIEYLEQKDDPVIAIYKHEDMLVQVLSLEILFSKINKVVIESKEVKNGKTKVEISKEEDSKRFLIFYMEKEKFAIDIEFLQEIILAERDYTHIAGTTKNVVGLITLREDLLLVVDLRSYFGFKTFDSDKNRILIASYNGQRIGLLIDSIIDIKVFSTQSLEYMENDVSEIRISGVIHDNESLISFFDSEVLEKIIFDNESFIDSESDVIENEVVNTSVTEVIVFKLLNKEYAFEVESVDEIIDIIDSTKIAYSDEEVDGIINIRGQIVTIVSLFKKLNLPTTINKDSKIIICNIDGDRIGFVVDSVSDILNIKEDEIKTQEDSFFTDVYHLDNGNRLILAMDINKIVHSKDL